MSTLASLHRTKNVLVSNVGIVLDVVLQLLREVLPVRVVPDGSYHQ